MPTRSKTLSILGDATDLPFLLRTGKVQQNAADKGDGRWSIPNGGFTSQLKYKTVGGRFVGQLAGYTFFHTPTYDGYWTGSGRAKAQQPHITLFEVDPYNSDVDVLINGRPGETGTTGWTAGAGTTISNVSTALGSGRAIKVTRTSTTGTASVSQSNTFSAGKTYTVNMSLLGTTAGNNIYLYCGTQEITNRGSNIGALILNKTFTANQSGDLIIKQDNVTTSDYFYVSAASVIQNGSEAVHEIWLCDEGDGVFYSSLDALKRAALAKINTASDLDYELRDGDIVCLDSDMCCFMAGPVPWVCGWGYYSRGKLITTEQGVAAADVESPLSWVANPGLPMPFSSARASRSTPNSDPQYTYETSQGVYSPSRMALLAIRNASETVPPYVLKDGYELTTTTLEKNHSEHAYYWQCDFRYSDTLNSKEIYNSSGSVRLRYIPLGATLLDAGDVITIGPTATCKIDAESASASSGLRRIDVLGKSHSNADFIIPDIVYLMPPSLQWMTGWFDYYAANPSELPPDTTISSVDPFPIVDATTSTSDSPVKILKQLLGFPASSGNDAGIPPAFMCTTVADLFGYSDGTSENDRTLIDFAALRELWKAEQDMDGVTYTLDIPQNSADPATIESKELNILQLLQGVCITLGVRMTWKYSEAQRSWVLSFKKDGADTIAEGVTSSRVIDDASVLLDKPSEIQGGSFNYAGLKSEYKLDNGVKEQFNITDPSGMVQHRIGGKVLEVKDDLTLLPSATRDVSNKLIERFGLLVHRLAQLSHKIRLNAKLSMASRLRVGDGIVVDLENVRNPLTGRQNDGEQVGNVESMTVTFGPGAKVSTEIILSRLQLKGISPALYLDDWDLVDDVLTATISTNPDDNDFAAPSAGLTDAQCFDCYSYSDERGAYLRDCGCSGYSCYLIKRGAQVLYISGANKNVFACTVYSISGSDLALTITDDITNLSLTGEPCVLIFAPRDDANLQPCQHNYYGYLGDGNGLVYDSNDIAESAIVCGG